MSIKFNYDVIDNQLVINNPGEFLADLINRPFVEQVGAMRVIAENLPKEYKDQFIMHPLTQYWMHSEYQELNNG